MVYARDAAEDFGRGCSRRRQEAHSFFSEIGFGCRYQFDFNRRIRRGADPVNENQRRGRAVKETNYLVLYRRHGGHGLEKSFELDDVRFLQT